MEAGSQCTENMILHCRGIGRMSTLRRVLWKGGCKDRRSGCLFREKPDFIHAQSLLNFYCVALTVLDNLKTPKELKRLSLGRHTILDKKYMIQYGMMRCIAYYKKLSNL